MKKHLFSDFINTGSQMERFAKGMLCFSFLFVWYMLKYILIKLKIIRWN